MCMAIKAEAIAYVTVTMMNDKMHFYFKVILFDSANECSLLYLLKFKNLIDII